MGLCFRSQYQVQGRSAAHQMQRCSSCAASRRPHTRHSRGIIKSINSRIMPQRYSFLSTPFLRGGS